MARRAPTPTITSRRSCGSGQPDSERIGNLPMAQFTQLVSTPTSNNQTPYVLKVIDVFGQYTEDTTQVNVVDTTPPKVTAPTSVTAECTGSAGTPVSNLGTA